MKIPFRPALAASDHANAWRRFGGLAGVLGLSALAADLPMLGACVPATYAAAVLIGAISASWQVVLGAVASAVAVSSVDLRLLTDGAPPERWPELSSLLLVAVVCAVGIARPSWLGASVDAGASHSLDGSWAWRDAQRLRIDHLTKLRQTLFDDAPIPMLLEDWSGIKRMLAVARSEGVTDWDAYFQANPAFIREAQGHHHFLDANRATVNLFGAKDKSEFLHAMATLLPKSPTGDSEILRAMVKGHRAARGERVVQTLDGRTLTLLWQVDLSSETAEHLLFMAIDITDRKKTEEALLKAQADLTHTTRAAVLGEMAASIAHEVNQPLAAIVLYAESAMRWLARPQPELARASASLERIARGARHAGEVVQKIKGFVRKEAPEYAILDVDEVFADTQLLVQREARNHRVRLIFESSRDLPSFIGVKVQVQQVLVNLIVNAVHALSTHEVDERLVVVSARPAEDQRLAFEVRDNGPGVPPQDLGRIFDAFFSTRSNGLGLGLAICLSIVKAHGGDISAINHGNGAAFAFTLRTSSDETEAQC